MWRGEDSLGDCFSIDLLTGSSLHSGVMSCRGSRLPWQDLQHQEPRMLFLRQCRARAFLSSVPCGWYDWDGGEHVCVGLRDLGAVCGTLSGLGREIISA